MAHKNSSNVGLIILVVLVSILLMTSFAMVVFYIHNNISVTITRTSGNKNEAVNIEPQSKEALLEIAQGGVKCIDNSPIARINRITPDGWAEISAGCGGGGARVVYHFTSGAWQEVTGFQSSLWCSTIIDEYQISSQLYPYCNVNTIGFTKWPSHTFTNQEKQDALSNYGNVYHKDEIDLSQLAKNPLP